MKTMRTSTIFGFFLFFAMLFSAQGAEAIKLDFDARGPLAMLRNSEAVKAQFGDINVANLLSSVYDVKGNHLTPLTIAALKYPLYINSDAKPSGSAAKEILLADSQLSASERKTRNAMTKNPVPAETSVVHPTASNSHSAPKAKAISKAVVTIQAPKSSSKPKPQAPAPPAPSTAKAQPKAKAPTPIPPTPLASVKPESAPAPKVTFVQDAPAKPAAPVEVGDGSTDSPIDSRTWIGIFLLVVSGLGGALLVFFFYAARNPASRLIPKWIMLRRIKKTLAQRQPAPALPASTIPSAHLPPAAPGNVTSITGTGVRRARSFSPVRTGHFPTGPRVPRVRRTSTS